MKKIYLYSALIWIFFAILATINGIIRNATYQKILPELLSHQISTLLFLAIMFIIMFIFFKKTSLKFTNQQLWIIGTSWLIATITFEFIFGHFVFGNSWQKLLADYQILKGRIWILVPIFTLIGPRLIRTNNQHH